MSLSLDYRILKMSKGDSAYDLTYSETLEVCRMMRELEEERNLLRQKLEAANTKRNDWRKRYELLTSEYKTTVDLLNNTVSQRDELELIIREAREQKSVGRVNKSIDSGIAWNDGYLSLNDGDYLFASPVPAMPIQDDSEDTFDHFNDNHHSAYECSGDESEVKPSC